MWNATLGAAAVSALYAQQASGGCALALNYGAPSAASSSTASGSSAIGVQVVASAKTSSNAFYGVGGGAALVLNGVVQAQLNLAAGSTYAFASANSPLSFTMYFSLDPYGANPSSAANDLLPSCVVTATASCTLAASTSLPAYFFYQDAAGSQGGGVVTLGGGATYAINLRVALPFDNSDVELVSNKPVSNTGYPPTYGTAPSGTYYSLTTGTSLLSVAYTPAPAEWSVCAMVYQQSYQFGPIFGDSADTLGAYSWMVLASDGELVFYGQSGGQRVQESAPLDIPLGLIAVCLTYNYGAVTLLAGTGASSPLPSTASSYEIASGWPGVAIGNVESFSGTPTLSLSCFAAWDGALSGAQAAAWAQANGAGCVQLYVPGTGAAA